MVPHFLYSLETDWVTRLILDVDVNLRVVKMPQSFWLKRLKQVLELMDLISDDSRSLLDSEEELVFVRQLLNLGRICKFLAII